LISVSELLRAARADVVDLTAPLVEIADDAAHELVVDGDLDGHDRLEP
jgi:hypothetical protein